MRLLRGIDNRDIPAVIRHRITICRWRRHEIDPGDSYCSNCGAPWWFAHLRRHVCEWPGRETCDRLAVSVVTVPDDSAAWDRHVCGEHRSRLLRHGWVEGEGGR